MDPNITTIDPGMVAIIAVSYAMNFLISAFTIVVIWLIFNKAKRPGWAALIPFYNSYILNEISGLSVLWFVIGTIFSVLSGVAMSIGFIIIILEIDKGTNGIVMGGIISLSLAVIFSIVVFIWWIKLVKGMAKSFGQSTAFAVGLFFFYVIFMAIIAFDKKIQYQGDEKEIAEEAAKALE